MIVHRLNNNSGVILSVAKDLSNDPGAHTKTCAPRSSIVRFLALLGMTV